MVSGSPPVLVLSSPFGSTAAAWLAWLPPVPWQAVNTSEIATSRARIDHEAERRCIIRSLQEISAAVARSLALGKNGWSPRVRGPAEASRLPVASLHRTARRAVSGRPATFGPRHSVAARRGASIFPRSLGPLALLYPAPTAPVQGVPNRHARLSQVRGDPSGAGWTPARVRGATSTSSRW